ncbi:hypothetical protein RJ45_06720 [Photobacterium gaetbulicola]|uniref:Carbohydrate kinase FGGY N-terminal domain-containing protein n=1 Tax=Photobacterium gaetbulicola TaxID=1295392 RepID=A0A0B9H677_9GAMM|nr:FGGY family carbohydrate kinase [Photobacterium gaetbulicola]KHT64402.1 hypothetical protein RJ45_06720 [Photobacterium gaetbulicola]
MKNLIAIDLGAGNGRVTLGCFDEKKLLLNECHWFENNISKRDGYICWDIENILTDIKQSIESKRQTGISLDCFAIDSCGGDFVPGDKYGEILGLLVTYRDARTKGVMKDVIDLFGATNLYKQTVFSLFPTARLAIITALVLTSQSLCFGRGLFPCAGKIWQSKATLRDNPERKLWTSEKIIY